jgi:hypothetical protein
MRSRRFFMKWKFDFNGSDFTDKLSNLTQVKIFKEIVYNCNKQNLKWEHSEEERLRISAKLKISEITFKRALQGITKSRLITRVGRGVYQVNPDYVTYGQHGD